MTGIAVSALDEDGAPQVGIVVNGLDAAASSIVSVDVSWNDGATWQAVRGAQRISVIGGGFFRDHVPPLNVTATYRLTVHTGATVPPDLTATVLVASTRAWVQDPLNPRLAFSATPDGTGPVSLSVGALAGARWAQAVDVAVPIGAALPVASVGTRAKAADVALTVTHLYGADSGLVRAVLMAAGQIVVRGLPAADLLDPVAHVALGDVTELRRGTLTQSVVWELVAQQVRATGSAVVVPWWTYASVFVLWAPSTYAEAKAARPGATYLDWAASPERP